MHDPRRILLIRPSALGDVCRTVPVLVSLKRAYPDAAIDWLVQDTFAPAIENHPDLTDAILFPRQALARWARPSTWPRIRSFLALLQDRNYDLVLDCQGLARSGLFSAATHAPRRIGLANAAELGWLGLTEGVFAPRDMHAVERMLLVARAAGAPPVRDSRLYSCEADRAHIREQLNLQPNTYALLAPTTRWPGKLWPGDRFAELAKRLLAELIVERVAFVGAASERDQCGNLQQISQSDPRIVDLVGRTTVGQLMAAVEGARIVVASDSAALHMAVGFDRPLVGLFGPTPVPQVGPFGRERDVIQHITPSDRLNHKDTDPGRVLMQRITVNEVIEAVRQRSLAPILSPRPAPEPAPEPTLRPSRAVVTVPSSPATPSPG